MMKPIMWFVWMAIRYQSRILVKLTPIFTQYAQVRVEVLALLGMLTVRLLENSKGGDGRNSSELVNRLFRKCGMHPVAGRLFVLDLDLNFEGWGLCYLFNSVI